MVSSQIIISTCFELLIQFGVLVVVIVIGCHIDDIKVLNFCYFHSIRKKRKSKRKRNSSVSDIRVSSMC